LTVLGARLLRYTPSVLNNAPSWTEFPGPKLTLRKPPLRRESEGAAVQWVTMLWACGLRGVGP
jgi:hypothetical protein